MARLDLPEKVLERAARARRVFPAGPVHLAEGAVAARSRAAVRLTVNAENTRRVRSQRMQYALKKSHDCVAMLTGCGASQSAGRKGMRCVFVANLKEKDLDSAMWDMTQKM